MLLQNKQYKASQVPADWQNLTEEDYINLDALRVLRELEKPHLGTSTLREAMSTAIARLGKNLMRNKEWLEITIEDEIPTVIYNIMVQATNRVAIYIDGDVNELSENIYYECDGFNLDSTYYSIEDCALILAGRYQI